MGHMREDRRHVGAHLLLAREALDGANVLLKARNRNAVYLAQQGAEQLILAVAQSERVRFPRDRQHQLDHMVRMLPGANPFRNFLDDVTWLEAYASTYRYPRTSGRVSPSPDAHALTKAVLKLYDTLDLLVRYFDVDLGAREPMASHCVPPRPAEPGDAERDRVDYVAMAPG